MVDTRAAVLHEAHGDLLLTDVEIRSPVDDEVLGRGTLALVGLGALSAELPVGLILAKGLRVRGVVEGDSDPHAFLPRLTELWRRGELPLDKLVTRFDFDTFGDAWAAAKTGRAVKPVVEIGR